MTLAPSAAFALLAVGCASSAPAPAGEVAPVASLSQPPASAPAAAPAIARDEVDAGPGGATSFAVRNDGVGPLVAGDVSEESVSELFPDCHADWQRHKGRATPHIQLQCQGVHVLDVVLASSGQSGPIDYVRVYREGISTPSGLGVGSSFQALADLTDDLVCRGIVGGSGAPGVIVHDHTLCMSPLFPNVAYVFRRVVFQTGERPDNADSLRIGEIRWSPKGN